MVTQQNITRAAVACGLRGAVLCVHSSLSSFGHVVGGARAVVDGLLDADCTVMVPAFSYSFAADAPPDQRPTRNAWDYCNYQCSSNASSGVFSPSSNEIDDVMGAVAIAIVNTDGRSRGDHPLNSFAAVGPMADELVTGQRPLDVYAPLRELGRLRGYIVLMGVDLRTTTALHLAERMAGRVLFRRWAIDRDGSTIQVAVGGCSRGFNSLGPALRPIERRATIGRSQWRIFPIAGLLERASEAIREQSAITRCGVPECDRCIDAIAGGPILDGADPEEE